MEGHFGVTPARMWSPQSDNIHISLEKNVILGELTDEEPVLGRDRWSKFSNERHRMADRIKKTRSKGDKPIKKI